MGMFKQSLKSSPVSLASSMQRYFMHTEKSMCRHPFNITIYVKNQIPFRYILLLDCKDDMTTKQRISDLFFKQSCV